MGVFGEMVRLYPAVTVVVVAFKAVCEMDASRRQNDRRIIALNVEMKDMMGVLVNLKKNHQY